MKVLFKLIGIIGMFGIFQTPILAQELVDKVVAQVGSELVLLSDVEDRFALMKERQPDIPKEGKCSIMESLMATKLMVNQAILDSVLVSDVEIEGQIDARLDRILTYMGGDESQFEEFYGKTVAEMRQDERAPMKEQLLADRMRGTILSRVTITPSEVIDFYNSVPVDSLPYYNSEVELSEIVYKPEINEEERERTIEKAEGVRAKILAGESFEEMAGIYSDEPGAAQSKGDLGWQKRGNLVPEFEAAAYRLDENEISEIVETEFGFHLIKMLERRGNAIHVRHILFTPEITGQDLVNAEEFCEGIRQKIVKDSMSFGLAVKRYSEEKQQSYHNGGRMVNPKTGNTFFEIGDLETDIYFSIDTMEVGDVSGPIQFRDQRGKILYRIIHLQSRTLPHRANLKEDYNKIQTVAKQSKENEYFSNWISGKVKDTYIELEDRYSFCPNLEVWKSSMKQ